MTNEELDNYMKTVNLNFDSHIEKGTIEMSNEYYNLLEEKMARLINENQELRKLKTYFIDDTGEKLEYTLDDYMTILDINIQQNEQICELKKQVEEYQKELEKADNLTQICIFKGKEESKISYRKCLNILDKKETQQKAFIKYLEDEIEDCELTSDLIFNHNKEMKIYKEILQKYKEIIGVLDEKVSN